MPQKAIFATQITIFMMNQDTICAIATAQGGAIGSIRVSGADAIRITSHIFTPAKSDSNFRNHLF